MASHPTWEVDADLVFTNNLCFTCDVMAQLSSKACRLKVGSKVITTKALVGCEEFLELREEVHDVKMTSGRVTVFIYQRRSGSCPLVEKRTLWYGHDVLSALENPMYQSSALECMD